MQRLLGAKPNPLKIGQIGLHVVRKQIAARASHRNVGATFIRKMLTDAPKRDQIGQSCVGETAAQCLGALDYVRSGFRNDYSPLSAYYYARKEEAMMELEDLDILPDDGTFPFAALMALKKHGIAHLSAWPHDPKFLQSGPPSWGAVRQSDEHRTTYFYTVDDLQEDKYESIRAAVLADCPVGITIPVSQAFCEWKGEEVVHSIDGPILGYHRLPILGWTSTGCGIIRSSWVSHGDEDQNLYFAPELLGSELVSDVEVFFDGVTG
jgi:hypothetical protein